ncbi:MAG: S53 family peptidase [Oligoflexia bacterium]|nr:S53 family peptidase [Oligoflexia bacterium]
MSKRKMVDHAVFASITAALALTACSGSGSGSTPGSASCAARPKSLAARGLASAKTSHIPRAVQAMADQGAMASSQAIPVTIALNLSNAEDLNQKLVEMYEVGNPNYHRFMTPQEFHDRYAPSAEQLKQVTSFLQAHGLTVKSTEPNGYLVHAEGSAQALNTAFDTEIHNYKDAKGNAYFAPSKELTLPSELPIQAVHGLQNITRFKSYAVPKIASASPIASSNASQSGLAPSDIRTAYQVPSNVNGAGQTLAVMELDGYTASDVTTYESNYGLPQVPLQNILVDSATGSAGGGAAEVTLDIELMTAIAPGASAILVYEAPNSSQSILDNYARIASDNKATAISSSWGSSEGSNTTSFAQSENTIFMQMAAQGQSIFAASGDSGADDNGSSLSVDDPAGQPYVVGVGGTTLTTGTGGTYVSETAWNNASGSISAGGGGISSIWSQPSYQSGVANSSNLASATMRNVPDVALEADANYGYAIYEGGTWGVWGGTSCAAPLWAAFTALVNQQRAANGFTPLGFPNPALYSLGQSGSYASLFHDITSGTNGYYPAKTGYDDATGWGSFIGQFLFESLTSNQAGSSPVTGC